MQDKKYQIFISSTYKDLIEARQRVSEAILNLYHLPVGMEMFSADDDEQWEVIKEIIDLSDYYILIVGHRYGSITKEGISYTEKEYNYAVERGIPVLAFIRNRDAAVSDSDREDNEYSKDKLELFLSRIQNKLCDYWDNDAELTLKVTLALSKIFTRKPQIGWVRGNQALQPEIAAEIARLSNENNQLKKQLEKFNTQIVPKLEFTTSIQEINLNNECLTNFQVPKLLDRNDISKDLQPFISDSEIYSYNCELNNLIDSGEMEKLVDKIRNYFIAKNNYVPFTFNIRNVGMSKAHDLYISIHFPNEIKVVFKDKLPEKPKIILPTNPIEKARKKYDEQVSITNMVMARQTLLQEVLAPKFPSIHKNFMEQDFRLMSRIQLGISIENNSLHLNNKDLLHTKSYSLDESDDVVIYPLKAGHFIIKVEIMCAEYLSSEIIEIPITVIEKFA